MITDEIGGGGGGAGISGSALANLLTGYATQDWVGENYISIEFFSRLFQAHGTENGQQTDIDPNDMDSTITSIESLFGFWTDYYLSALGNGGGLGSTLYLSTLADVLISSPANNQVLTYNASTGKWVNANAQAGAADLANLTDVALTTLLSNQVLMYDGTNSVWINSALKTINGQPLYGSGDISVGGGASGNYLPLSGGTLTGSLTIGTGVNTYLFLNAINDGGIVLQYNGVNKWQIAPNNIGRLLFYDYTTRATDFTFYEGKIDSTKFLLGADGGGLYLEEPNKLNTLRFQGQDSGNSNYYVLSLTRYGVYITASQTESLFELSSTRFSQKAQIDLTSSTLMFLIYNGSWYTALGISVSNGYVGIGVAPSYKLHVDGTIYATGAVTALSDIRKKDVLSTDIGLTVEQIADAPTIKFLWKDRREEGKQVGSVAQFWASNLPEVVMDKGGELSMQYGVAALVSAIITARKVVDHERRISELEKENERLKTEVEQLRLN